MTEQIRAPGTEELNDRRDNWDVGGSIGGEAIRLPYEMDSQEKGSTQKVCRCKD